MSGTIGDARKALAEKSRMVADLGKDFDCCADPAPAFGKPAKAPAHLMLEGDTFSRCCGKRASDLLSAHQELTADPWATTCGEEAQPNPDETSMIEEDLFIDWLAEAHVEIDPTAPGRVEDALRTTLEYAVEYVDSAEFIFDRFKPVKHAHAPEVPSPDFSVPRCVICKRERTAGDPAHPMDAYDYSAVQVIAGQPVGWYSGDDGEICPEDMANMLGGRA